MSLQIATAAKNAETVLTLAGRLDTATAPDLEKAIDAILGDTTSLVLDFTDLVYISSAGLRVILKTQKAMNTKGKMTLKNVTSDVMEVFELTGFVDFLTFA